MRAFALMLALAAAAQSTPQKPAPSPPSTTQNHGIIYWNMSRSSVDFLLNTVPQPNPVRMAQLRQVFIDLQCRGSQLSMQPAPEGPNLLCTLPGTISATQPDDGPPTILFLAHYEHEGTGQSAIENWSGAVTLPCLYHALAAQPRRHTFLFAEVAGEAGAKALFDSFTPVQRRNIMGVIALDALGLGPAQYYVNPNDNFNAYRIIYPVRMLFKAADDEHAPGPNSGIPGAWFKVDDVREFRHHGIPSVVIHSVDWKHRDLPGSARDTPSAIDHDVYYKTLNLLDFFITELDRPWPSEAAAPTPSPTASTRRR